MTSWNLVVQIDSLNVESLAASMHGEIEPAISGDKLSFSLNENAANDLRAMWNTRMRSVEAVESVMSILEDRILDS